MAEFRHVSRIMVSLWGQRVGMIVSSGSREESYAFQYDRRFLKSGIEISPLMMPPSMRGFRLHLRIRFQMPLDAG